MKNQGRFLLAIAVATLFMSCKKEDDPGPTPPPPTPGGCQYTVVQVSDNITGAATWEACKVYLINTDILVSGTLTVQPGAIVKFKNNTGITIGDGGSIRAVGTPSEPIVFTSFRDDAHGGDNNGDGPASKPSAKDWDVVRLSDTKGAEFAHCKFMYSGQRSGAALELLSAVATIQHCTFTANAGGAPEFDGALHAKLAGAGTIIQNNVFYGNEMPLSVNTSFGLDNSNTFHQPDQPGVKNAVNGIWIVDSDHPRDIALGETEVPFVFERIGYDRTLSIAPGVVFKGLADARIQLGGNARILARGKADAPIVFTSYLDDSFGGDTNGDGATTKPASRNWADILLDGTNGSVFEHCVFRYGGNGAGTAATLNLHGSIATVRHCTFSDNYGGDSNPSWAVLDASNARVGTVIEHNVFYNNIRPLSISPSLDLDNSNVFHNPANPAQKNVFDAISVYWDAGLVKPYIHWGETEVAYTVQFAFDVASGNTLELDPGVVVKFGKNAELILRDGEGRLKGGQAPGVVFTSIHDDSVGGDSDGNGSAVSPAGGDWNGVYVDITDGYWAAWPNIRFDSH